MKKYLMFSIKLISICLSILFYIFISIFIFFYFLFIFYFATTFIYIIFAIALGLINQITSYAAYSAWLQQKRIYIFHQEITIKKNNIVCVNFNQCIHNPPAICVSYLQSHVENSFVGKIREFYILKLVHRSFFFYFQEL